MTLSLRHRIWVWSAGSVLASLFVFFLIADNTVRTTIRTDLEENLSTSVQLAADIHRDGLIDFRDRTGQTASSPTLMAAAETGDSLTIGLELEAAFVRSEADWLAVVAPDGEVLARTEGASLDGLAASRGLLTEARFYDTADLWRTAGGLVEVAASGIYVGDFATAVLLAGRRVDAEDANRIGAFIGPRVAVLAQGRVVGADTADAARLDEAARLGALIEPVAPAESPDSVTGREAREFLLGREPYLGVMEPVLGFSGEPAASILVYQSLAEAMAPADALRLSLIVVSLIGVGVAFWLGLGVARSVTAPVQRLLEDAQRLGRGQLDRPIGRQRPDEIGRLAEGFDRMRVSLREAQQELVRSERLSAIGQMASSIVHDFSSPITGIRMNAELLELDGPADEAGHSPVRGILSSVNRLERMMQEVLEFGRGTRPVDTDVVDVGAFADDVARFWERTLGASGVSFSVDGAYRGEWRFDSDRIRRVVDNLIKNAQGALGGAGSIRLRAGLHVDHLRLEVEDTGPGIPVALRETLFQPFVTHGKKDGTGLGLAICKSIVERHGGTISVESAPGRTCFTIELPDGSPSERSPQHG